MIFNENSRVKIPALLHLLRLGYTYISLKQHNHSNENTNIFVDIFIESLQQINPDVSQEDLYRTLDEISSELDYDDLGKTFYQHLTATSGIKLIDFTNFNNNSFHVTTELTYKNGHDEFRPDITLLINGMPLAFIEVKKPYNKEGIIAERKRINDRFKNKLFRRFVNITQLLVFSNNMKYEDDIVEPISGAYYATSSYRDLSFNYFREDENYPVKQPLRPITEIEENTVLSDNKLLAIKNSSEFKTNKDPNTPTHQILTSLFSRERFAFLLRYAIAYIEEESGVQKQIMRYPQIFATQAIVSKLKKGCNKGIIWHTQGSGKTALAYYNIKYLTDYYQRQNIIPKFYFIVDRLDLLIQASIEFSNRGVRVNRVNSKQEFIQDIKVGGAIHNDSGLTEITVVNIQKFSEDSVVVNLPNYGINTQRIYFLDEAHRSYNPKGNYLANLINSDKNAIIIALTGTPLLRQIAKDYDTKLLFGEYIHKYFYNQSIADGYTLRLIREEIEGSFKMEMKGVMEQINILHGVIKASDVYADKHFAQGLLDYITTDLINFRKAWQDDTLGGMVVCDSSKQAKVLFELFEKKYGIQEINAERLPKVAEDSALYGSRKKKNLTAALILHDENDKNIRKELIKAYKACKIDLLFVYNMLLTGFDAKRLKKLYLARVIQDHNLLQTLTRVNRPYKKYEYGYVVDFADISQAFDRANRMYFNELRNELGNENIQYYTHLFKSEKEIKQELQEISEMLFYYDTTNREIFSQQIAQLTDKVDLLRLIKAFRTAKELKNIIALNHYENLKTITDFGLLNCLLIETQNRLENLNFIENMSNEKATQKLLSSALETILFQFIKIGEEELKLADEYKESIRKTREVLHQNFDQKDPYFVSLVEEFKRIFKKNKLSEIYSTDWKEDMLLFHQIYKQAKKLNSKNALLKAKYKNDEKYTRIHKRLIENGLVNMKESQIHRALLNIKDEVDNRMKKQEDVVHNEGYFALYIKQLLIQEFKKKEKIPFTIATTENINQLIVEEYKQQYLLKKIKTE